MWINFIAMLICLFAGGHSIKLGWYGIGAANLGLGYINLLIVYKTIDYV